VNTHGHTHAHTSTYEVSKKTLQQSKLVQMGRKLLSESNTWQQLAKINLAFGDVKLTFLNSKHPYLKNNWARTVPLYDKEKWAQTG